MQEGETSTELSVMMAVMEIGIMGMLVAHRLVPVPMRVGLGHRPVMQVLVMLVMHVAVLMLQSFMGVLVLMTFGKMQPKSNRHQDRGNHERHGYRFPECCDRYNCTDERSE